MFKLELKLSSLLIKGDKEMGTNWSLIGKTRAENSVCVIWESIFASAMGHDADFIEFRLGEKER